MADADAQNGFACRGGLSDRLGGRAQGLHGIAERGHARQNQSGSLRYLRRVPTQFCLTTDMMKRVADALDVAHTVINYNDHPKSLLWQQLRRQMRIFDTPIQAK